MPTSIEQIGPCRRKLQVEISADKVAGVRTEVLKEFRKSANIPGFRPGHAPEPLVENRYLKAIDDELRRRLVPEGYRAALAEHKVRPVGQPEVEGLTYQRGQAMTFIATVDTAPEFALPTYKELPLRKKAAVVTAEQVTEAIDGLRDQQADFLTVTGRGLQTGDFAVISYSGVVEGKPISELVLEAKTLGENKDFWVLIASDSFLAGFCDQLLGAQPGEKRQVLIDFPADFPQAPLAGRKATYFVDVTAIKEKKLPQANDEFAKKVGVDSLAKLQEEIRKSLLAESEDESKADLRKQIIEQLVAQVQFELPDSLVAQETRNIVYDVVRDSSLRGATKAQLEEKKDEIYGYATRNARERLRVFFILEAIARAEQIAVTEPDIQQRTAQLAQRYRVPLEKLRRQLADRGGAKEIEEQILVSKTLDFLLANAKVEPVS